jgi:hypothetical protein
MTTKSGSNKLHGSGVWNVQNSALDAYDFADKDNVVVNPRAWRNVNNYTVSVSGPIIKNKTFFFVSWDHQISRGRTSVAPLVLTPCARKGIYRYLSGVRNTNAITIPSVISGNTPQRPVVDLKGNPLNTYTYPVNPSLGVNFSGKTETAALLYQSTLGQLSQTSLDQIAADPVNCSQYQFNTLANNGIVAGSAWDDYRNKLDQSGYVQRFTDMMPPANDWQVGDGLNTAAYRWTRSSKGSATIFGGNLYDDNRKALTFKIDHNINAANRISGTYSYETNYGDDGERVWPEAYNGYGGVITRKPQTFTMALTSTLKPTLLNELRIGMSRTESKTNDPLNNPDTGSKLSQVLQDLMPTTAEKFPRYAGNPVLVGAGAGTMLFHPESTVNSQPFGGRGNLSTTWGGVDPRWTFSDTITWIKGAHSFKGGVEYRTNKSYQESNGVPSFANGADTFPSVKGGVMSSFSPYRDHALVSWTGMPAADIDYVTGGAATSGNYAGAYNLMTYMTGSIGNITQYFFATDAKNPRWNNADETFKIADLRSRELSFFLKDDWKVNNLLTLNLGMRFEYYGVPWDAQGLTAGVKDGFSAAMGASGGDLSTWMPNLSTLKATGANGDTGYRTQQIFIGPNSANPGISAYNKDLNNFAPHVGFALQLPWFGAGKTTLRGGYSISYTKVANFDNTFGYSAVLSNAPGLSYAYNYIGSANCGGVALTNGKCYLNFDNFGKTLPLYDQAAGFLGMAQNNQPTILGQQPIFKRDQSLGMYDPNIRNPYVQNLTLSLTRSVGNNLTLDVRYIGSLTRKSISSTSAGLNMNTPNLINSGLMAELIKVRGGGESAMLNDYIKPGTLYTGIDQRNPNLTLSGSAQIRGAYAQNIANGNMVAIASALATANGANNGILASSMASGVNGLVLRYGGAPENLIYTNPQYASVSVRRNQEHANYHSMQAQVTMRPARGLSFQTTYTWSRNLASQAVTDYRDWSSSYWLSGQHRTHQLNVNGMFTLPFGANGFIFRNASGVLKKAVEGWQIGWIASAVSGVPMSLAGNTTLWANGSLNQVGPFDTKSGKVDWDNKLGNGFYFGHDYVRVTDPQCSNTAVVASSLKATCINTSGLRALVHLDPKMPIANPWDDVTKQVHGQVIFQNALPGEMGNFIGPRLTGPGRWSLDMNMGKMFDIMEGKKIDFRIDAQDIFNHATPSYVGTSSTAIGARNNTVANPFVTVNTSSSNTFGLIDSKTGHRTFQAKIRILF